MNLIVDDIKWQLNNYPESKFVITGLDRCGKSTFLSKFAEYKTYKENRALPIHPGDINWRFRVFDRYPLIEAFVNTYGNGTGELSDKLVLSHIINMMKSEFKNSVFLFNYYPRYRHLRDDDDIKSSQFDSLYISRYHMVAMAIKDNIEGAIVIERHQNFIIRYQNDK